MKELSFLVNTGHGRWVPDLMHPQFGNGLWEFNSESCNIKIFDNGIVFLNKKNNEEIDIDFREIQDIKSFLTGAAISEASGKNSLENSLPMKITTQGKQFDFDVPLVLYSAVLISIQELRQRGKSC
jgi:hypothetical protein